MEPLAAASRSYRLEPGEETGEGLRRIALGRIDHALEGLRDAAEEDFATGVHEARKDLKKLRALLRLLREHLGDEAFRGLNRRFRDAGRTLAGARDAEVKLATLRGLEERFPVTLPIPALAPLHETLEAERPGRAAAADLKVLAGARSEIDEGRGEIERWELVGSERELLAAGMRRAYKRGRRGLRQAQEDPTDHNAHEWRKRVKDLWYGLRLIEAVGPESVAGRAALAHRVSELVGDHHDLSVLAVDVRERDGLGGDVAGHLLSCIDERQNELLAAALAGGNELYAEKPKRYVRQIGLGD